MRRLNIWQQTIFCAVILAITPAAASADGIVLGILPISQSVALGAQVTPDLEIVGLGDPPSLGTFDVNIGFDPTILTFSNATFGDPSLGDQLDPTGGGNTISFITPGVGTVELFELSLDSDTDLNSLQASGFVLASLTFNAIGVGTSPLTVSINALGDADGNSLSASIQSGSVNVPGTSVPEPRSVLLLGSGLAAICIKRAMIGHS